MIGVRRLRAVAIMLAAAIVTIAMWTSPPSAHAAGVQCLRQAAVPSAPAGAIVLARSLSSTASGPNVVVIPVGSSWTPTTCPASAIVAAPTTISVGSGAALVFQGPSFPDSYTNTWVTSWGAVDVTPSDPAPDIDPGGPSPWTPTEVDAITPQASLNSYQSCRA